MKMRYSATLQASHLEKLRELLLTSDGRERAAFLLCGRSKVERDPWTGRPEERFLSREVVPLTDDELIASERAKVTFDNKAFLRALKMAESKDFAVALVHSHPPDCVFFSKQDDEGEKALFSLAYNRNGSKRPNLSLVLDRAGNLWGRSWDFNLEPHALDLIRVIGPRLQLFYEGREDGSNREILARQALAFGEGLNRDLKKIKVAIVGCGGTGSATAMLLARLGVGLILLIDTDVVDVTNLNRLHGASMADALNKRPKVEIVADSIKAMGLGTEVHAIRASVEDIQCRDGLKSVDVIFGCTDDHLGRTVLNRFAYWYLTPVIDMGLASKVNDETTPPEIMTLDGRTTILRPQGVCMLCRKIIDPEIARSQALKKKDPTQYEQLKKEAYVRGEENPSPAVVTFTTETACMAVNELIDALQGFRGEFSGATERRRFFKRLEDRRTGAKSMEDCPVCSNSKFHGRGDMSPFLDLSL